jgi:hypothetical protein
MYRVILFMLLILFLLFHAWKTSIEEDNEVSKSSINFEQLRKDCQHLSTGLSGVGKVRYASCAYYPSFQTRDRFFIQCYLAPVLLTDDQSCDTLIYFCPPEKKQTPGKDHSKVIMNYKSGLMSCLVK